MSFASTSEHIPVMGLFEAHLTAADLDRSVAFYRDVLGLPLALEVPERGAAFLWIGGSGEGMLARISSNGAVAPRGVQGIA